MIFFAKIDKFSGRHAYHSIFTWRAGWAPWECLHKCPQGGKCLFAQPATVPTPCSVPQYQVPSTQCHSTQYQLPSTRVPSATVPSTTVPSSAQYPVPQYPTQGTCHSPHPVPWVWSNACQQGGLSLTYILEPTDKRHEHFEIDCGHSLPWCHHSSLMFQNSICPKIENIFYIHICVCSTLCT